MLREKKKRQKKKKKEIKTPEKTWLYTGITDLSANLTFDVYVCCTCIKPIGTTSGQFLDGTSPVARR